MTKDLLKKKKNDDVPLVSVIIRVMQMDMQMKGRWDNFYYYRWNSQWFVDEPKRFKFIQIYSKISYLCNRYKSEKRPRIFKQLLNACTW